MKRRDFLKFLGTIPFGIKAFQPDSEEPETSIEEPPQIKPNDESFRIYTDPGMYVSGSTMVVHGLQFLRTDDSD